MVPIPQKIDSAVIVAPDAVTRLHQLCPDLANWPQSWSYEPADLAPGQRIVDYLKPFLLYLLDQKLATKTLHRHRDHLWALGGEVIRRRQDDTRLRKLAVEQAVYELLEEDGGPLIWPRISESAQRSFDATCRKLYRYVTTTELGLK